MIGASDPPKYQCHRCLAAIPYTVTVYPTRVVWDRWCGICGYYLGPIPDWPAPRKPS